jgi:hypothetical protein
MDSMITQAATETQLDAVRELIREYTAWAFTMELDLA